MFLENAGLKEPKTKELVGIIKALGLKESRTLFIADSVDEKLKRASRNLQELVSIKPARDVNAYHISRRKKLLVEKQALRILEPRALGLEWNDDAQPKTTAKEEALT